MNKRIQQFLELEDLTPARLAEILGIQRSGLSHIIAGRNKPSYDFIEKMLNKFPTLNAEWLILGKGKPYKSQSSVTDQPVQTQAQVENTPEQPIQQTEKETVTQEIKVEQPHENQLFDNNVVNRTSNYNSKEVFTKEEKPEARHISKIIILYSDGTFEER